MASTYLHMNESNIGTPTSNTQYTISVWVKRASLGTQNILSSYRSGNEDTELLFDSSDRIEWRNRISGSYSSGGGWQKTSTKKLRDTNGWYHIVAQRDGADAKIFVNGDEVTYSTDTQSSGDSCWNTDHDPMTIGVANLASVSRYFDGSMSHFHFCDGNVYAPTVFGSVDSTTGEWKINTGPTITMGNNGFTILKDGNTITDQSANSNDFTLGGGTLTKTEDNPSNVFCVWNKLTDTFNDKFVLANGNTTWNSYSTGSSTAHPIVGTIGLTKGKWYWENYIQTSHGGNHVLVGVTSQIRHTNAQYNHLGSTNQDYAYHGNNGDICNNSGSNNAGTSYGDTFTAGDYIGVFLDLDNNKIYFSKNGTVQNSGTGHSITDPASTFDGCYYPALGDYHYSPSYVVHTNFGNGVFASTALTGTTYNGADGNGIFKYDPTSVTLDGVSKSFNAISTKGLNA